MGSSCSLITGWPESSLIGLSPVAMENGGCIFFAGGGDVGGDKCVALSSQAKSLCVV